MAAPRLRRVTLVAVLLAGLGVAVAVALSPAAAATAPAGTPTATSPADNPTVGPIFRDGLDSDHACTASVVASPTRDLILTAAHCLTGSVTGWLFVPDYDTGQAPYGVWTLERAYLPAQWLADQDPHYDYAILQVAPQVIKDRTVDVQEVTGANLLGYASTSGQKITDVAYNTGLDDQAIGCTVTAYVTDGYPSFNCHGYIGGSSGSPWLTSIRGTSVQVVRGVVGGLNQGGCYDFTSYSAPFTDEVVRLLHRAELGVHPDTPPSPGSDGC